MKKFVLRSALTLLAVLVLAGGAAAYFLFAGQDRGMTRDGRMAPPLSVRNAPEAPKFDASKPATPEKTAEHAPDYQLPTEFKLPTDIDISAPAVPDGISAPAAAVKG